MLLLALLGLAVSLVLQAVSGVRVHQVANSFFYKKGITALLAGGLFASVYGISRPELLRNARVVLVAITFGVAIKAVLSGGVMALAYGSGGYLLLGVAVAQIDPLSVAASLADRDMSDRAKSVLSAWASFDDPVTVLLVAYLAPAVLPAVRQHGQAALVGGGAGSYLAQLAMNAGLVAVAGAAWYLAGKRFRHRGRAGSVLLLPILAVLMALAVIFGLLVGITVCGLFFRPSVKRFRAFRTRVVDLAFYVATFLLGMLIVTGVDVPAGVLLGVSVFAVQMLAGTLISRGMLFRDRVHLALGQQNGLTAIVLALALQPYLPAAVGVVAIAIVAVNVLNIAGNDAGDLWIARRLQREEGQDATGREGSGSHMAANQPAVIAPAVPPAVAERPIST